MLNRRVPRDDYYYRSSTMRENLEFVTINTNFNIIYYNFRFETCNTFFFLFYKLYSTLHTKPRTNDDFKNYNFLFCVCVRFE